MNFAPKDLCEKLIERGCHSLNPFYYKSNGKLAEYGTYEPSFVPVFTLEDFVANTEQARENAKIVWPGVTAVDANDPLEGNLSAWALNRHAMIDADDPWKFLESTMRREK